MCSEFPNSEHIRQYFWRIEKEPSTLVRVGPAYLVVFSIKNNQVQWFWKNHCTWLFFSKKTPKKSAEGRHSPHGVDPLIKRDDYQTPAIREKKFTKKWNFFHFWRFLRCKNRQKISKSPKAIWENWPRNRRRVATTFLKPIFRNDTPKILRIPVWNFWPNFLYEFCSFF